MFESFKVDRKSISENIVEHMRRLIHEGKLRPGERVPPERELAQTMDLSRNTVREAYKILAAQGYLTIKHGHGVFVTDTETQIQQFTSAFFMNNDHILELFSIRKVLETQAVKWAIENYQPRYEIVLMDIVKEAEDALKTGELDMVAKQDLKFHLTLSQISGNTVLVRIMMNLIDLLSESRTESIRIPGRAERSLSEHKQILQAIVDRDMESAVRNMLDHLTSVEQSILQNK